MDQIAYFSKSGNYSLASKAYFTNFNVERFDEIRKVLTYLITMPSTPYLIFESNDLANDRKYLEAIYNLNEMLPIVLLANQSSEQIKSLLETYKTVILCTNHDHFESIIKEIKRNPRKANRVHWPLTAKFFKDPKNPIMGKGNITSLSIGGLFIKTSNLDNIHLDDKLYFDIAFMDFSFLVEGIIVNLTSSKGSNDNVGGLGVKFENISEHTQKYIQNLINHKLINMLIHDL